MPANNKSRITKTFRGCINIFLLLQLSLFSFSQLPNETIKDLKTGRIKENTSFVYSLPFAKGKKVLLIQGSNGSLSHKNELAFDFKVKAGTPIFAARAGIILSVRADSDKGGLKNENLADGNYIIIQHPDGSVAQYWHLQFNGVLVKEGDVVAQGQQVGLSGNTGYSAFPHLHFQVIDKAGLQILPRFQTSKGILYLRPGRKYR